MKVKESNHKNVTQSIFHPGDHPSIRPTLEDLPTGNDAFSLYIFHEFVKENVRFNLLQPVKNDLVAYMITIMYFF